MKKRLVVLVMALGMMTTAFAAMSNPGDVAHPKTDGYYLWEATSKRFDKEVYGSWKEACREYTDGNSTSTLTANIPTGVFHTYTGVLQVSIAKILSFLGLSHLLEDTWTESVQKTESLAGKAKGTWAIEFRPVYDSYKVTQTRYYVLNGLRTKVDERVVTVKKYKSISFRMRKISDNNIAKLGAIDYE